MLIGIRVLMIILFLGLSLFVYFKDRKSILNKVYSAVIFTGFIWSFTVLMADIDLARALFWSQLSILGPILIPPTFLLFSIVFPRKAYSITLKKILLIFIPSIILCFFIFTKFNIESISIKEWGTDYRPGILYFFVFILFAFYIGYSLKLLLKKARQLKGLERQQILYVLMAIIVAAIIGFVLNLLLPFFVSGQSSTYGPTVSSFAFFLFTTYAILRYRLMDIRVIIRRSAVFAVLVLIITSIYALFAYLISVFFQGIIGTQSIILNGIITAVLVAFGFEPLKTWLSQITDKFLFKAEYNPQEVLAEFSDKITSTLDLNKITQFIVSRLHSVLKPTYVSLFLLDEDKKQYYKAAIKGQIAKQMTQIEPQLFNKIFSYLKSVGQEKDIVVREEVIKINEQINHPVLDLLVKQLEDYGVNLIVPMFLRDKLVGILFLGDKKSGDIYSQQDLRVLEIISSNSAVSVQNSQLFEEQRKFADKLKIEVAKATKELKVANIQLKKLDKAKSEFISIASHQLRTPLTVIKGYISMINQGDFGKIPKSINSPIDRVYKSTLRIINLVEDLLNISRIESGRMKYELEKIDLLEVVKNVFEELEQHAKNKGLKFVYHKPAKKVPLIVADQKKIREVVMNLMDNAIKYTDQGKIDIILEIKNSSIIYCVADTGRGIEPDEMPMLFQKFSRAKGAQLVHTEGTGLGLYIAKQIVKKHGGKIWAESEGRNKGSKFCIEFKINNKKLEREMGKKK